jgi:signal transduction histidine kinase
MKRFSLWAQLALVLVFLVSVPLVVLGYWLIHASQTAVKTSVLRDQEQLAIRAASELDEFIKLPKVLLNATAAILGTTHADPWKQETVLVELGLSEPIFNRISFLDNHGKEAATSEIGTTLKDLSESHAFKKALAGEFFMSDVFISADHMPYATMSVPVRQFGKTTGVLLAEVNLRGLWDIVDNIKIGHTGRAYVVSDKGFLIAHEDKKKVLANERIPMDATHFPKNQARAQSHELKDASGKTWLEAHAIIKGLGWQVVVNQSSDEAYSFSNRMKTQSLVLILCSIIAAIILSIYLAQIMAKPIRQLAFKTGLIAQGDFDQHMATERQDEIGDLIGAFNQMAEKLKKAREAERLTMIGKAAAAIAHELKNSLMMASTFIGLLPKRANDKEFIEKFSRVVPQELDNWKSLLQDIADFSRQSKLELTKTDLGRLILDLAAISEEKMNQNQVRLETVLPENAVIIQANGQKIKQVLNNLLINAAEAMPGGGSLRIEVRESEKIEIRVRDTGKGIAAKQLASIFEPFYTTKSNGLGLGLAICKEIVDKHGGQMSVESQLGSGTEFILCFPRLK